MTHSSPTSVEVLIGTGIRKGEALGFHWNDVHLDQHAFYICYTLSALDSNRLVLTTPKTRCSRNWVAISPRVAHALRSQATIRTHKSAHHGVFVFHYDDGRPIHPQYALNHFHSLCLDAGAPRTTLHDLRHLSATISITAGTPLTVVSKTLRHSTLSTTANIYAHLTTQAARQAVDAISDTLDHAPATTSPADAQATGATTTRSPRGTANRSTRAADQRSIATEGT